MKIQILLAICLCFSIQNFAVLFQGLIETGVNKNTFLCSADAASAPDCKPADSGATGFDLAGGKILQLFNNQACWLLLEASEQQREYEVKKYSGSALQAQMQQLGWVAMGGYCLVITSNPILTKLVMPTLQPGANEEKVVVQLWYNGNKVIQLWSQDAAILTKGQGFQVAITANVDSLSSLPASTTSDASSDSASSANTPSSNQQSLRQSLLSQIGLQINNRDQNLYTSATQSPRSVQIQVS